MKQLVAVRIDEDLLADIDAAAAKLNLNRSQFIIAGARAHSEHILGRNEVASLPIGLAAKPKSAPPPSPEYGPTDWNQVYANIQAAKGR